MISHLDGRPKYPSLSHTAPPWFSVLMGLGRQHFSMTVAHDSQLKIHYKCRTRCAETFLGHTANSAVVWVFAIRTPRNTQDLLQTGESELLQQPASWALWHLRPSRNGDDSFIAVRSQHISSQLRPGQPSPAVHIHSLADAIDFKNCTPHAPLRTVLARH